MFKLIQGNAKPTLLAIADGWWFNSNHIWKDVYDVDENLDDVNISN